MAWLRFLLLTISASAISVNYIPDTGSPPHERELSGLAYDSAAKKVYIYGGRSKVIHGDMWEFDLTTRYWNEMHPASVMSPGARSAAYLTILEESKQLVLFGGDTENGPISDVWLYDIDSEIVRFIQWQTVITKGKAPPRSFYRTVCDYIHEGKHYLAVYGGRNRVDYVQTLYILDLDTFTWTKLSDLESGPLVFGEKMNYYNGSFYIYTENSLYIYSLYTNKWTETTSSEKSETFLVDNLQCIYEDSLYLILGWDNMTLSPSKKVYKIDLSDKDYKCEEATLYNEGIADWSLGYTCQDNMVYIFGGSNNHGFSNNLSILDLSKQDLEFQIYSKLLSVPSARKGHAMEAYGDKLYIFGGVDGNKKSLIDMWAFDINSENWSPISSKSSFMPTPRSEFAHARYLEDFIIFGGKGDTELFNDIYRYSTKYREWKPILPKTAIIPTARRAACMAVSDDFILIFGGIEASGYSNELWKFDWNTYSYTLLDSYNSPPKAAFSHCHIETNSENQSVFKVYIGETEGENPIAFIYEYNLSLNKWFTILEEYTSYYIGRSKAAAYMIDDKLIVAGGSIWSYTSYYDIHMIESPFDQVEEVLIEMLPAATYYAASAYYKNRIYIHGGGYSFGSLPLSSIVKNDLIVIHLNQECEDSEEICIDSCSKGTYYMNKECISCPMGSYSANIGSSSCEMCKAGYFSDLIGAETSNTCKPCPYGYFNTREGESFCMECPNDSICSLDQISPIYGIEIPKYTSIQPDLLDYKTDTVAENSRYFYIFIICMFLVSIILLGTSNKTRVCLRRIDMYSLKHNYQENQPMYIRKTLIGGIFTTAFIFAALAIVFTMFLSYGIDNIRETKALVPLAALEQQYDNFFAEEAKFEFEFRVYGGQCGSDEGICTKDLNIDLENVVGTREDLKCEMIESNCKVSFILRNFELIENGKVSLKLSQPQSLCSGISLRLETSSSIPDEVSSVTYLVWSGKDYFFRGSTPSTFSYLMTPSLFKTDSNIWDDEQKGYHISVQQDPTMGSRTSISELSYSKTLQVEVLLYKNWAVLYTQRLQVQPIGILLSNLSGAIVGILGLFGSLMSLFEGNYIKYTQNKSNLLRIRKATENRESTFYKNFISNQADIDNMKTPNQGKKPEQSSDDKISKRYKLPRSLSKLKPDDFDLVY